MIRLLLALLLAPLLSGAAPAARDWTSSVARTAQGAYVIGNPGAKVKLVEYLSYTCSHCAHFAESSARVLKGFVKSGSTRVEIRHAVRDKVDLAATVVAQCAGPAQFWATSEAIFAAQADWHDRGHRFEQVNARRMALYPEPAQLRAIADGSGLSEIGRAHGLTDAAITACFADEAALLRFAAMSGAAFARISGTPSFELNGQLVEKADWAALEAKLRAAGAK